MDWKLELVAVPVSDIDRAKAFYADQVGFHVDYDHRVSDELRFVQLTPPGSACSIALGIGISTKEPGSRRRPPDRRVGRGRRQGAARRAGASTPHEVQDFPWGKFVFFRDPDGNGWALQELPPRS